MLNDFYSKYKQRLRVYIVEFTMIKNLADLIVFAGK